MAERRPSAVPAQQNCQEEHASTSGECPLSAKPDVTADIEETTQVTRSGALPLPIAALRKGLFDHLVGANDQRCRYNERRTR